MKMPLPQKEGAYQISISLKEVNNLLQFERGYSLAVIKVKIARISKIIVNSHSRESILHLWQKKLRNLVIHVYLLSQSIQTSQRQSSRRKIDQTNCKKAVYHRLSDKNKIKLLFQCNLPNNNNHPQFNGIVSIDLMIISQKT